MWLLYIIMSILFIWLCLEMKHNQVTRQIRRDIKQLSPEEIDEILEEAKQDDYINLNN